MSPGRQSTCIVAVIVLFLGLFAVSARAIAGYMQAPDATPLSSVVVLIDSNGHRRVVRDFFKREAIRTGLAQRESLPPELITQVRAQGRLPPGLEGRLTAVPPALGNRLPGVPPTFSRYFAGRDLVIVDTRTERIVSVIQDILP